MSEVQECNDASFRLNLKINLERNSSGKKKSCAEWSIAAIVPFAHCLQQYMTQQAILRASKVYCSPRIFPAHSPPSASSQPCRVREYWRCFTQRPKQTQRWLKWPGQRRGTKCNDMLAQITLQIKGDFIQSVNYLHWCNQMTFSDGNLL